MRSLRGRLVDQVDRLVGQEAVGDVAVRERGGGDQRAVLDAHAVVDLVALLQAAQDRDRVLHGGLADDHRLEAALERGVLLDVLAVLVERGGADARSSPRASIGLSRLAASTAPSAAPAPTIVCSSSRNRMIVPCASETSLRTRLQAFLELAAVRGAGDQRAHVQRDHAAVAQRLGHVAGDDPLGEALDDRGLADAGLADQHGVVLGAPGEHLDHAADLLVAADDRVELALLGDLGEVAPEALAAGSARSSGWPCWAPGGGVPLGAIAASLVLREVRGPNGERASAARTSRSPPR